MRCFLNCRTSNGQLTHVTPSERNVETRTMVVKTQLMSCVAFLFIWAVMGNAAELFRYPEATYEKGKLKYCDGIAVVIVQGSPTEIGEQMGTLVLKPATR